MDSFALSMALRSGALPLLDYLAQVEARFQAREPSVLAFVPGTVRFDRLRREAEALLARYPDPPARPPLFGLLVGVKDIFHPCWRWWVVPGQRPLASCSCCRRANHNQMCGSHHPG